MTITEYSAAQSTIMRLSEVIRLLPLEEIMQLIEDTEKRAPTEVEEKWLKGATVLAKFKELVAPMLAIKKARSNHRLFFDPKVNQANVTAARAWLEIISR